MSVNMNKKPTYVLLAEARAIRAHMDVLKHEYDAKVKELALSVGEATGKHDTIVGSFTIRENNIYSEDEIRAVLKPGQLRRVSKMKLDKSAVKALYPKVYAASRYSNGVTVVIG